MTNYNAKILNNSIASLKAQQALLTVTSNNISNVNTPGYARRKLELEATGVQGNDAFNVGNGVSIGKLSRVTDQFIDRVLREAHGTSGSAGIQDDFLDRAQEVFDLTGSKTTIGSALTGFFSAMKDLSQNASSLELRSVVIQKGQELTETIRSSYNTIANLQDEADQRIGSEISSVNSLAAQIADLNGKVKQKEDTGELAADERDKRDRLLNSLAEKISFSQVETPDGQVTLSLANGFAIVSGTTARPLEVTKSPSFASGGQPISLSGQGLSYIVYDYDPAATNSHIDLSSTILAGSGTIGGLLKVRGIQDSSNTSPFQASGPLVGIAARIEGITRQLLTSVNNTYLGGDGDTSTVGTQPSARDLDGNPPQTYGLFDFDFSGPKDTVNIGVPDSSDLEALSSSNIYNFSSRLKMTLSNPRELAAGRDLDTASSAVVTGPGEASNAQAIGDMANSTLTFSPALASSLALDGTFDEAYTDTVSYVGNESSRAKVNAQVAQDNLVTAQNHRDETSGVSLDEEFTNLIKFQKSYQASARMIKVADDMLQRIVELI